MEHHPHSAPFTPPTPQKIIWYRQVDIIWLALWAYKKHLILRCDWLPDRVRWRYLAYSGLPAVSRMNKSFIDQAGLFDQNGWILASVHNHAKTSRPISRHVDFTLGQQPYILTCARFSTTKKSSVRPLRTGGTNVGADPEPVDKMTTWISNSDNSTKETLILQEERTGKIRSKQLKPRTVRNCFTNMKNQSKATDGCSHFIETSAENYRQSVGYRHSADCR